MTRKPEIAWEKETKGRGNVPTESRSAVKREVMTETATDSALDQWSLNVHFTGLPSTHKRVKDPSKRLCYIDCLYLYLTIFKILKIEFTD